MAMTPLPSHASTSDESDKRSKQRKLAVPGITANRSRTTRAKHKAKWLQNRAARAALNAEFTGEVLASRAPIYHARLEALARGLA